LIVTEAEIMVINAVTMVSQVVAQTTIEPVSPVFDSTTGSLYVADKFQNCVVRISSAGVQDTIAGTCSGASSAVIAPTLLALDSANQILYILDRSASPLKSVSIATKQLQVISTPNVSLSSVQSMTFTNANKTLYFAYASSSVIYALYLNRNTTAALGTSASTGDDLGEISYINFANTRGLAVISSSELLISVDNNVLVANASSLFVQPLITVSDAEYVLPVQNGIFYIVSTGKSPPPCFIF
jgi:hypothetical protein